MKILIAEDELLERKSMKKFIATNFKDFNVVGEAPNGRIAIELAADLQPDIIFMDIKMPGINGLEAIDAIYTANPTIRFVLVSAYDTFDYAKEAMKYGIKDYLLKPAKNEEIVRTLLRLQKEITEERKAVTETEGSDKLIKDSLIRNVMESPVDEETKTVMKRLYPKVKNSYFLVLSMTEEPMHEELCHRLEASIKSPFLVTQLRNAIIVLVILSEEISKSDQLIFVRKLSIQLGDRVYIGIGCLCNSFTNLPTSYQEAYETSFQMKADEQSNYSFYQVEKQEVGNSEVVENIVEKLEQGKREAVLGYFTEHATNLSESDKEVLYISVQHILKKHYITEPHASLAGLRTTEDWQAYLHICSIKINEHFQSKQLMTQAREYIEKHYQDPLSLEELANVVNLSPNYFSNMFKEAFGETFIELLTKIRMEKAREFITENEHSLKEISFLIGYKDPNYFSRVFKRYYHLSPKQFQKRLFKN